jgi:hypothetical protein
VNPAVPLMLLRSTLSMNESQEILAFNQYNIAYYINEINPRCAE